MTGIIQPPANQQPKPSPSTITAQNPFLIWLAVIGGALISIGILVFSQHEEPTAFEEGNNLDVIGSGLFGSGVMLGTAWLAAAAICWQLERLHKTPPKSGDAT